MSIFTNGYALKQDWLKLIEKWSMTKVVELVFAAMRCYFHLHAVLFMYVHTRTKKSVDSVEPTLISSPVPICGA